MPSSILIVVVVRIGIFARIVLVGVVFVRCVFVCRVFVGILSCIFIRGFCVVHVVRVAICAVVAVVVCITICVIAVVTVCVIHVIRVVVCVIVIFSHYSIPPVILVSQIKVIW